MAISDKPWSNFSPSDYDNAQWKRACLIHMDANSDAKADHKLPIMEPDGTVNRNAVHAAAAVLAGARGGVQAPPDQKRRAAKRLASIYHDMKEQLPDSVRRLAQ